jgi:hypothetical protein
VPAQQRTDRLFYLIAACLMLIFTAGGFRNFYLHGRAPSGEVTTQIFALVTAHGVAMFAWVILFLVQSTLIQTGRRKLHLVIGPLGVALAGAIVILGSAAAALSVHYNPRLYDHLGGPKSFLATMLIQMLSFGTFVFLGWFYRRQPAIHRPMMLLATVVMQSGALSRFPYIGHLSHFAPLYVWSAVLIFGAFLFVLQAAISKSTNRPYLLGYSAIVVACFLSVAVGNSALWDRLAATIVP